MTDLSPEARRLIVRADSGDDPSDEDEQRIGRSLGKRIAVGAAALGVGTGAAKSAVGATAALGSAAMGWGKTVVWVALGLGAAAGAHQVYRALSPPEPPARTHVGVGAPPVLPKPRGAPPDVTGRATPGPADAENAVPAPSSERPVPPLPAARETASRSAHGRTGAVPEASLAAAQSPSVASFEPTVPAPASHGSDNWLTAETSALRQAHSALRSGEPAQALRLIDEQNADYADGALVQERAATRVFALCELGRGAEARAAAAEFEQSWPNAPMLRRVRAACAPR
jgi:hypothetical protein